MTYYDYFGLTQAPYKITPDTDAFYAGGERGAILDALVYAVKRGEAITKVVGEVGSGKTMLCRLLGERLHGEVEIVYLMNPSLSPREILHAIAIELGLRVSAKTERFQVMKKLEAYLLKQHAGGRRVAVFVEEAQCMPWETLEEIRLLTNLETGQEKLLQVVLFGQPELDEVLSKAHVRQIKERITNSLYLPPLNREEVGDYLMFRLRLAGYRGVPLFSALAVRMLKRASHGLMRRLNILADKAMLAAYADGVRRIGARYVWAAMRDCEFGPRRRGIHPFAITTALAMALIAAGWLGVSVQGVTMPAMPDSKPAAASSLAPAVSPSAEPRVAVEARAEVLNDDADLFQTRLAATRAWLRGADENHFTIQVLLGDADQEAGMERFLRQAGMSEVLDRLYIYRAELRGKPMYGVVYGDFPDYAGAQAALENLPAPLRRHSPFLRNLHQVHAEWMEGTQEHAQDKGMNQVGHETKTG